MKIGEIITYENRKFFITKVYKTKIKCTEVLKITIIKNNIKLSFGDQYEMNLNKK